jgi:SAM-dependent methyltransferase
MNYVNELIAQELEDLQPRAASRRRWLDLGCGVGGSLAYLADRVPGDYLGITISERQAALAEEFLHSDDAETSFSIIRGDFCNPGALRDHAGAEGLDGAHMIESFIHATDPRTLLESVGATLRPDGLFIIVDDFLTAKGARLLGAQAYESVDGPVPQSQAAEHSAHLPLRKAERKNRERLLEFIRGWHVQNVRSIAQTRALAESFGLRLLRDHDLTPFLELDRPRDRFIRLAVGIGRLFPLHGALWDNMLGGNAVQQCLKRRLIEYRVLVFQRA